MLLKNLIKKISKEKKNINILGLSTNSKEVKKNFIFFAIKGNKFNGEKFIHEAIVNGAIVIICSNNCKYKNKNILVIKTKNIRFFHPVLGLSLDPRSVANQCLYESKCKLYLPRCLPEFYCSWSCAPASRQCPSECGLL